MVYSAMQRENEYYPIIGGVNMPWDTQDFPDSLKNLQPPIKKKAIDIANAMVEEGYDENRAIPIAISQAKEWYENASEKEKNKIIQESDADLKSHDSHNSARPELIQNNEHVVAHENGWAVQVENAKQPSEVFANKRDAVSRARYIAKNKKTNLIIHKKDGTIQEKISY